MDSDNIEQLILSTLAKENVIQNSWDFSLSTGIDHQAIIGAVKSLLVDNYVIDEQLSTSYWELLEEGKSVLKNGSPEVVVFNTIASSENSTIAVSELNQKLGEIAKIGVGACMKNKWVKKVGDKLVKDVDSVVDEIVQQLETIALGNVNNTLSENDLKNLKRRQLVEQKTRKSCKIMKGADYREVRVRKMPTLTKEMLTQKGEVRNIYLFLLSCIIFAYLPLTIM